MFVNIGFGNFINSAQIISISRFDSAPMKRLVQNAKDKGMSIDATQGRKTKSVIVTLGIDIRIGQTRWQEDCHPVSKKGSNKKLR